VIASARDIQSDSNSATAWRPGKLWSLWDMLKFNASEFYQATSALRAGEVLIEHVGKTDKTFDAALINAKNKKTLRAHMRKLDSALSVLGARVTAVAAVELIASLRGKSKYKDLVENLAHLRSTLRRELSLINVFVFEEGKSQFFDPKEPLFG
jgi:hypothetical protein